MFKKRSLKLSRLIWAVITSNSIYEDYCSAEYSTNNRTTVNRCESSLIYYLKRRSWVQGKDGKLHTPGSITLEDISEEFKIPRSNSIIKALVLEKRLSVKRMLA